jgi:hypothetical protein
MDWISCSAVGQFGGSKKPNKVHNPVDNGKIVCELKVLALNLFRHDFHAIPQLPPVLKGPVASI